MPSWFAYQTKTSKSVLYICIYIFLQLRIIYEYESKGTRILTQFRRKAFEDFQDGTDEAALDPRGLVLQKMKR